MGKKIETEAKVEKKGKKIKVQANVYIKTKECKMSNFGKKLGKISCYAWKSLKVASITLLVSIMAVCLIIIAVILMPLKYFGIGKDYNLKEIIEDVKCIPQEAKNIFKEEIEGC